MPTNYNNSSKNFNELYRRKFVALPYLLESKNNPVFTKPKGRLYGYNHNIRNTRNIQNTKRPGFYGYNHIPTPQNKPFTNPNNLTNDLKNYSMNNMNNTELY
jgi:hypothetical protein